MRQSKSLISKLFDRLKANGLKLPAFPEYYDIQRTHAGTWQKKAGAWSWFILPASSVLTEQERSAMSGTIGGYSSLSDTLKAKAISIGLDSCGHWSIDIEPTFTEDQLIDRLGHRLKSFNILTKEFELYPKPESAHAKETTASGAANVSSTQSDL